MNESSDLVIANFVLPLIKDLLLPKISAVLSKFSNVKNSNKIERIFEEYLTQRYEHFLIIDTLVFPNKQTLFKELYEPLTVTDNFKHSIYNRLLLNILYVINQKYGLNL